MWPLVIGILLGQSSAMPTNAWTGFFIGLAVIASGGVAAATWESEAKDGLALMVGVAAVAQAFAGIFMMRGLRHAEAQAKAAAEAVVTAQIASERQLRAYVDCVKAALSAPLAVGEGYELKVCVKNLGQTPARNVRVRVVLVITNLNVTVVDKELFDRIPIRDEVSSDGSLGSGVEANVTFVKSAEEAAALIPDLLNSRRKLLIKGRVDYVDIFGVPRWSTFARHLNSPADQTLQIGPTGTNDWD